MRPNSCNKQFVGSVFRIDNWENEMSYLETLNINDDELVLVSSPKNIDKEFRFIVVNGKVVTGSLYAGTDSEFQKIDPFKIPEGARSFTIAQEIVKEVNWQPDRVWVLDICKTKSDEWKVLEIGAFSCAGMYECDKKIIVEEVSKEALKEWKENHD